MRHPRPRASGYTLVELLVVAAIIGIVVGAAMLAWRSDPGHVLATHAQRLAGQIELAQAQVAIAGTQLAFSAGERGYAFWVRAPQGQWQAVGADDPLAARRLPDALRIATVHVAGVAVTAGERILLGRADAPALAVAIESPDARAVVATGAWAGRIDVRIMRRNE